MDSLRVDSGIKKIEVNDDGEYINIPVHDVSFFERFGEIAKSFEQKEVEYSKRADDLAEKHKGKEKADADAIADTVAMYADFSRDMCAELDKLFGEGCCRKVFVGIENPSVELIGDFLDQITPLLNQYGRERSEKINLMYNRGRKGARSKRA